MMARLIVDGQPRNDPNDRLAVFEGDQIRGLASVVSSEGSVFHNMTIYSNEASGQSFLLKVYLAEEDRLFDAITPYTFTQLSVNGTPDSPFEIRVSTDGDLLISLDSIEQVTRQQGMDFPVIALSDYLVQEDEDSIMWSLSSSDHFHTNIVNDSLYLSPIDFSWHGMEVLTLIATEDTDNAYADTMAFSLVVEESYAGPEFDSIPDRSIVPGEVFESFSLDEYESGYEGACLNYSYEPILSQGIPQQNVSWAIGGGWPYSMSLVATVQYTPNFNFSSEEDRLGAFIAGELRGVAAPQIINGVRFFVMQINHTLPSEEMELRYYSDSLKRVFIEPDTFTFTNLATLGSPDFPKILDFSPLIYHVDSTSGAVDITIRDTSWIGVETVRFTASDCTYPAELQDTVVVQFCSGPDTDGDGLCDQLDPDPDDACNPDPLNGACDADGDGVFADVDPDDEDPCAPLVEVEVLSAAGPSCPDALDGHVEIGLTTPYCTGGRFDVYLEEPSQPAQQLGSGQLLPDTFRVESLGEGHYQLRVELSEAGSCTYSSSCFPYTVDSLAVLSSQDSLAPSVSCNSPEVLIGYEGSYELTVGDVYAGGFDACGIDTVYHDGVPYSCEDIGMDYEVLVTAIDGSGNESSCVSLVSVGQSVSLPPGWSVSGLSGSPGSADWDICTGNGLLGLAGAGVHSSTGGDSYLFVHQPFCASKGGLQLDLESVSPGGYIGLSARRSLSADAAMVGLFWNGSGVLRWEVRSEDGGERSVVLLDAPNAKRIRLEYFNETWRARYKLEGGGGWLNLAAVPMAQPAGSCFEAGVGGFTTDPSGTMSGTVSRVRVVVLEQQLWSPPVTDYDAQEGFRILVWPNPTTGQTVLSWGDALKEEAEVFVLGQFGQEVLPPMRVEAGSHQTALDLSTLPSGMYFIQCRSRQQAREVVKVIRE